MIISAIFWCLAAILNAVMDTLKDHFGVSIFKNKNPNFWNPAVSWNKGTNLFGSWGGPKWIVVDGWHVFKFLMLASMGCSVAFALSTPSVSTYYIPFILILASIIWGICFELFYSILLKSRK